MDTSTTLTFVMTATPEDIAGPFEWSRENIFRWLLGIVAIGASYVALFSPGRLFHFNPGLSFVPFLWMLAAIVLAVFIVFSPSAHARERFRAWPKLSLPTKAVIGSDDLVFETSEWRCEFKWSAFAEIIETRKLFRFTLGTGQTFDIPRRLLPSLQDVVLLRNLVRDNYKGSLRLRTD